MSPTEPGPQPLAQILFSQGFGTRRDCAGLVAGGEVAVWSGASADAAPNGLRRTVTDPDERFDEEGLQLVVQGQNWICRTRSLVALHKPTGYECSQKPSAWPSVILLLPAPLRRRGMQPVGRLDQDTTGLLLLTDDGAWIHRLTSPKHHVPKVYEVSCDRPVDARQVSRLLEGVLLRDDPQPVRAQACEIVAERQLRLTLVQGKYHQVKRMLAAVGNHVTGLHRSAFGGLVLGTDLAPGQWCWVDPQVVTGPPHAGKGLPSPRG